MTAVSAAMTLVPMCSSMGPQQACMFSVSGSAEMTLGTAPTSNVGLLHRCPHQHRRRPQRHSFCRRPTPARCRDRSFCCRASDDRDGSDTAAAPSGDRIRQTLTGLDLFLGIDEEADRRKKEEVSHLARQPGRPARLRPTPVQERCALRLCVAHKLWRHLCRLKRPHGRPKRRRGHKYRFPMASWSR